MTNNVPTSPAESPLVFVPFTPVEATNAEIMLRAKQIREFMDTEVGPYYQLPKSQGGLELQYVDDNPLTVQAQAARLQKSGPVQSTGLEYIFAYESTTDGRLSASHTALKGLAVLAKPAGLCDTRHLPTEVVEFDLAKTYRGQGLGAVMLQEVVARTHPADMLILDVAVGNRDAHEFYLRHGFDYDAQTPLQDHGVYRVLHQRMHARAAHVAGHLSAR